MQINELPTIPQAPADADVMAIEVNGVTYKVNKQALASAILSQIGAGSLSTSPSMLVNLESTSAANVMQASPRPGVTGILPISRGGIGSDMAAARTALGVLPSDFSIYNTVTDLGLTAGSATILAAWNALGTNAILICPAGEFDSAERPNNNGTVEIVRSRVAAYSYVRFYGKNANINDYRMFCGATSYNGNDADAPTGAWVLEADATSLGWNTLTATASTGSTFSDITIDAKYNALLRVVLLNVTATVGTQVNANKIVSICTVASGFTPASWAIGRGLAVYSSNYYNAVMLKNNSNTTVALGAGDAAIPVGATVYGTISWRY